MVVCSTDGDNTNIVVAQIAKKRFQVPKVVVRVLDPYRADWYSQQGLATVCPTQVAIEMLTEAVTAAAPSGDEPRLASDEPEGCTSSSPAPEGRVEPRP